MNSLALGGMIYLAVGAALYAILATQRLVRRYRLAWLSTYLSFQIFAGVYGIYGLIGQMVVQEILGRRGSPVPTIETVRHLVNFLGLPFLILAWYMFLRLSRELADRKARAGFTLTYFSVLGLTFLVYAAAVVWLSVGERPIRSYETVAAASRAAFAALEVVVLLVALLPLFPAAAKMKNRARAKAVEWFAILYLSVLAVRLALFPFAKSSPLARTAALLVFFGANIPGVWLWKGHLARHFVVSLPQPDGREIDLRRFFDEFRISKREEEVVLQICAGKTNKEISEALFISLQTVKDHVYRIFQKTDVRNRVQLTNLVQSYRRERNEGA
ncbi:MAG: LuxR C-terminal-related transcriptional regulator [Candidatus Aminicenantes bacterium]|nr:LuxR C-terminal-related transcriptional regulator [Candidatus Aminicenantes bacterium]